ncbi:MAG: DUF3859 domain-containing protein [Proteobacteria bacterium]|nr:DUF3859 domain-containing protein [Pseudomonadota bacterium]
MKQTLSLTLFTLAALLGLAALLALAPVVPASAAKVRPASAKKAAAPKITITGVKVLEFGVYTSTVTKREKVASVVDGIKDRATDFKLVRKSTLVDAGLGTGIGMKYVLRGSPKGAAVNIDVVVRHPAMVNPETKETMTQSTATFERVIGQGEYAVWSFDIPADLVPGEYVIELVYEGKVLAQKVFRVKIRK